MYSNLVSVMSIIYKPTIKYENIISNLAVLIKKYNIVLNPFCCCCVLKINYIFYLKFYFVY